MRSFKDSFDSAKKENAPAAPEEMIKRYSGMSEEALIRELSELTRKRRADGSYDRGSIERGLEALRPMLNGEQLKKLESIMSAL